QDAGGVVVGFVLVDFRVGRVLDLDPGHVAVHGVPAHDRVVALTHVDAGVGSADHRRVFDQHARAADGVHRVGAVLGDGSGIPAHVQLAEGHVFGVLHHD